MRSPSFFLGNGGSISTVALFEGYWSWTWRGERKKAAGVQFACDLPSSLRMAEKTRLPLYHSKVGRAAGKKGKFRQAVGNLESREISIIVNICPISQFQTIRIIVSVGVFVHEISINLLRLVQDFVITGLDHSL